MSIIFIFLELVLIILLSVKYLREGSAREAAEQREAELTEARNHDFEYFEEQRIRNRQLVERLQIQLRDAARENRKLVKELKFFTVIEQPVKATPVKHNRKKRK